MLKLHRKPFGVAIISWCKTSNSIENSTSNNQLTIFNKETQRANNMNGEVLCLLLLFLFEVVTIQNLVFFSQFFWNQFSKTHRKLNQKLIHNLKIWKNIKRLCLRWFKACVPLWGDQSSWNHSTVWDTLGLDCLCRVVICLLTV